MSSIPEQHRPAIRVALDALVAGWRPELLTWVAAYGSSGAGLVRQPDDIWDHRRSEYQERADGSAFAVVPLWTTSESPSDLDAELEITADGTVTICDVHVL